MDAEDDSKGAEDDKVTARCRFADAEGAKKALECLKDVEGVLVSTVLLTGTDEDEFWDEINAKLKAKFDNPDKNRGKGKGKGKKGKGKDKGKGEGKGKRDKGSRD